MLPGSLLVDVVNEQGEHLELILGPTTSVHTLKTRISEAWPIPALCQRLVTNAVDLEDDARVADFLPRGSEEALLVELVETNEELTLCLAHDSQELRILGVESLTPLARKDPLNALELLSTRLNDVNPEVRRRSVLVLTRIANLEPTADSNLAKDVFEKVSMLFAARVGDCDEEVRTLAIEGLAQAVKPGNLKVGIQVVKHLKDWRGGIRRSALAALLRLFNGGKADIGILKPVLSCMDDPDPEVRHSVAYVLPHICPTGEGTVIETLLARLRPGGAAESTEMQLEALEALWSIADHGNQKICNALRIMMATKDSPEVRSCAVEGLSKVAIPGDQSSIDALSVVLGRWTEIPEVDPETKKARTSRLAQRGLTITLAANASEVIDLFRQWDEDRSGTIDKDEFFEGVCKMGFQLSREDAETVFAELDTDCSGTLDYQELKPLLGQVAGDVNVRVGRKIGDGSRKFTVEDLEILAKSALGITEDEDAPTVGLCKEYPHLGLEVITEYVDLIQDGDPSVRTAAIETIGKIAHKGNRRAIAAVVSSITDASASVREAALKVLEDLQPENDLGPVIAVSQMLSNDRTDVRITAIQALTKFLLVKDESFISALLWHFQAPISAVNPIERKTLLEALVALAPEHEPVADAVCSCINDVNADLRRTALELLPHLSVESMSQATELAIERLKDRDASVRLAASKALAALGGEQPFTQATAAFALKLDISLPPPSTLMLHR